MGDAEFAEYAIKPSREVKDSIKALPTDLRRTWDEIEIELAEDPFQHRARLHTVGRAGEIFVYKHPQPVIEVTFEVDPAAKVICVWNVAAPRIKVEKTVFISYSHEDEEWLLKLKKFLSDLEEQDLIRFWDDKEIQASEKWMEKIKETLDSAKAALLLVSQDFLTSDFIKNTELPKLLEAAKGKDLKIFWIPVSACNVSRTPIFEFQALHDPAKPLDLLDKPHLNEALVNICRKLQDAVVG